MVAKHCVLRLFSRDSGSCVTLSASAGSLALLLLLSLGCTRSQDAAGVCDLAEAHAFSHAEPPFVVGEKRKVTHKFSIRNVTPKRIDFVALAPSCACSKAELDRWSLEPSSTAFLSVDVSFPATGGPRPVTCRLRSSAGEMWDFSLECRAYPAIEFADKSNVYLGEFDPGSTLDRSFSVCTFNDHSTVMPQITGAKCSLSGASISIESGVEEALPNGIRKTTHVLVVSGPAGRDSGSCRAELAVEFRERGGLASLSAPFSWNVKSPFEVSPSRLGFGVVSAETPSTISKEVLLRAKDGRPVRILDVQTGDSPLIATWSKAPAESHVIAFVLDASRLSGSMSRDITVLTDYPKQPTLLIPVWVIR